MKEQNTIGEEEERIVQQIMREGRGIVTPLETTSPFII